jgi:protein-S-isoprenylcysteine O-methyltransferase Ste14
LGEEQERPEEHVLIKEGPYSIVLHPIYAGRLGMLIATGLAFRQSRVVLIAVVLYIVETMIRDSP